MKLSLPFSSILVSIGLTLLPTAAFGVVVVDSTSTTELLTPSSLLPDHTEFQQQQQGNLRYHRGLKGNKKKKKEQKKKEKEQKEKKTDCNISTAEELKDAAQSGGSFVLCEGRYDLGPDRVVARKTLSLGCEKARKCVIKGFIGSSFLSTESKLTLEDLRFSGITGSGGVIRVVGGKVELKNILMDENNFSSLVIIGSITAEFITEATIEDCDFVGNKATSVVSSENAFVTMNNVKVESNVAGASCFSFSFFSELKMTKVDIKKNECGRDVIVVGLGTATMEDVTIEKNTVNTRNNNDIAVINAIDGSIAMTDVKIQDNNLQNNAVVLLLQDNGTFGTSSTMEMNEGVKIISKNKQGENSNVVELRVKDGSSAVCNPAQKLDCDIVNGSETDCCREEE